MVKRKYFHGRVRWTVYRIFVFFVCFEWRTEKKCSLLRIGRHIFRIKCDEIGSWNKMHSINGVFFLLSFLYGVCFLSVSHHRPFSFHDSKENHVDCTDLKTYDISTKSTTNHICVSKKHQNLLERDKRHSYISDWQIIFTFCVINGFVLSFKSLL